jgi:hypothetical protein
MSLVPSDVMLVLPEYNPGDVFRKVGGFHSNSQIFSDVDSLFQPGTILDNDASDTNSFQYRKMFVKNFSGKPLYSCKVWGQNVKLCNYIKFALERSVLGIVILEGSEVTKDYRTAPSIYNYSYTECGSDFAQLIGNGGVMSDLTGQGIWLRMQIPKNASDIATDIFNLGFEGTEVEP